MTPTPRPRSSPHASRRGRAVRRTGRALALAVAFVAPHLSPAAAADLRAESVGLNVHLPEADLLDFTRDVGAAWIRIDVNWRDVHLGPGRFDWRSVDRTVDAARARGLRVYATLAYTPDWVPRVPRARTDGYGGNDEPATSAEWVAFVEEAAVHLRARDVRHLGLWNEPNLGGFWEEAAGIDAYVDTILAPGAAAVRRRCADCLVLGPDLAHVGEQAMEILDAILTRAGPGTFDILAHHTYNGFPETGVGALDGDTLPQALVARRFPFTRAALREVLDVHGWTGEVWITETGYRARVGDAASEATQATYVRLALEEQLRHPWWTNTFFYEVTDCGVDQPACDIDGFGLTRPLRAIASGPRAFPADYRQKPAAEALRALLRDRPELLGRGAPAACGNGRDDDGDGRVDLADRGCASQHDRDESDDPPRRRLVAPRVAGHRLDGRVDDLPAGTLVALADTDYRGTRALLGGRGDHAVRLGATWSDDGLVIVAEVADDRHVNGQPPGALWRGDSLQVALDPGGDGGEAYDEDDLELGVALLGGAPVVRAFHGGVPGTALVAAVRREEGRTVYELPIPRAALGGASLRRGAVLRFAALVNEDDGAGREGFARFGEGISGPKRPEAFAEIVLAAVPAPSDPGAPPAGDAGGPAPPAPPSPASGGCGCAAPGGVRSGAPTARDDGAPSMPSSPAAASIALGALLLVARGAALGRARRRTQARSARRRIQALGAR
jgi:hypothetical protein